MAGELVSARVTTTGKREHLLSSKDLTSGRSFARKIPPPLPYLRHRVRVSHIQPVSHRGDMHPDTAHFMMRAVPILDLPSAEVVPGEAVLGEAEGQTFDKRQDRSIEEHPNGIVVVDGNDAEGYADLLCFGVVPG